jgi:hypothetical protein
MTGNQLILASAVVLPVSFVTIVNATPREVCV